MDTFVNRADELSRLNAILARRDGGHFLVSVQVVAGTAGAGKTSLALRWAHQIKEHFPDGQLFVNLRGYDPGEPVTADQALRRFLRALGVAPGDMPQDTDDAAALYRSLLADRRLLVLLDNAATAGQVRPLLPGSGSSLVLVTSRSRLESLAVRDGARRITLGTLPAPEAVALLRAVTHGYRPESDEDKLTELAQHCAYLPLALRIAAERAASRPYLGLDELIGDLRDESALWDTLSTGNDEADTVRSVFAWSYRALSPPSARLFRLLGLHPGPEFSLSAAAAAGGLAPGRTRQVLDDLVGAHLLEQTAPDRFQFHDLLRAYAAGLVQTEESPEQRQAALRRVVCWYLYTAEAARAWLRPAEEPVALPEPPPGVRPLAFTDYDAAADWSERELGNFLPVVRGALDTGLHQEAWQSAAVMWAARPHSSSEREGLDLERLGIEAAERADDPAAQTRLLLYMGISYRTLNRYPEGLTALDRAIELAGRSGLPGDEARALNLIGLIHLHKRELDPAGSSFRRALSRFRDLGDHHRAARAQSNLASVDLSAGRLAEAARAVEEALPEHRRLGHRPGEGNLLRIRAALQLELGDADAARRSIDDALAIALALRDHTLEGYWLLTLGDVQRAVGEQGDALASYQRSAMLHRRLGDPRREALAWRGTGQAYTAMGRADEAAAFHHRALAVHRERGDAWEQAVELDLLAAVVHPGDPEAGRVRWAEAAMLLVPYADPRATAMRSAIERMAAGPG